MTLTDSQASLLKTLFPLHDLVLVLRDPPPKSIGSIELPEQARNAWRMRSGTVIRLGPKIDLTTSTSTFLHAGARIRFGENAGVVLLEDGDFVLLAMNYEEIYVMEREA